jgi:hypothetical protein
MNSTNKRLPGARGIPQPFHRQAGYTPQIKPGVAQQKIAVSAQSAQRPIAPPVYRPQQVPQVLQTKSSSAPSPHAGQAPCRRVGSPAYRPEVKRPIQQTRIAQPKTASAAEAHRRPNAHPVHRPQQSQNSVTGTLPAAQRGKSPHVQGSAGLKVGMMRQQTIQRQKVKVTVGGITHLVAIRGRSIFRGAEGPEVSEGMQLEIETQGAVRSRRGPNQELFSEYDAGSTRNYRWFRVLQISGEDVTGRNLYVREDTVQPGERTVLPPRQPTRRHRERGDKLVRFEVWYNTDRNIDATGHLVMYDFERRTHFEIAQARSSKGALLFSKTPRVDDQNWMIEPVNYTDVRDNLTKSCKPYQIKVTESAREKTEGRLRKQVKQGTETIRFNRRAYVDVEVTQREYEKVKRMLITRMALAEYYFAWEARAESGANNPLASRCLSTLEDIAILRGYNLQQGHARDVLASFVQQALVHGENLAIREQPINQ